MREILSENSDGLSTDRLRHVRWYTKYVTADELDSTDGNEVELDEMIMIGNKACGKVALKSCFAVGKIASIKDMKIMKSRIH